MAIIAISLWIKETVRGETVFGGKFNPRGALVGKLFAAEVSARAFCSVNRGPKEEALSARALHFPVIISMACANGYRQLEKEIIMKSFLLFVALLCAVSRKASS